MTFLSRIDAVVRIILLAMLIASLAPVTPAWAGVAQAVTNIAIFVLFLLYGMRLSRREVLTGLSNYRLLVPLVLWVFGAMALAGWGAWKVTQHWIAPALALGYLFLGVLPSTVQTATVYSSIAKGNLASSIVAAALLNILAIFVSVPLFSILAGTSGSAFDGGTLSKVLTMLLLPFVLGQASQWFTRQWIDRHRPMIARLDKMVIGLAVYVAFSGAVVKGVWSQLDLPTWAIVVATAWILLAIAYGGSWLLGSLLRLPRADRISMLFAGGQKSIVMGAPLALILFPAATAGTIVLPLLVYHLSQMIVAAPIAARLGRQMA